MALTNMCTKYLGKTDPSRADPEGGDRVPGKSQCYRFLSTTGPEPLEKHKAIKSAANVGP